MTVAVKDDAATALVPRIHADHDPEFSHSPFIDLDLS